jgi:hypothetical protein
MTVDNVRDLSKLKHEERYDPADLKIEVMHDGDA